VETAELKRDVSKLSKRGKLDLLLTESPELLTLLEEFKDKMAELKDKVQPLVSLVGKVRGAGWIDSSGGYHLFREVGYTDSSCGHQSLHHHNPRTLESRAEGRLRPQKAVARQIHPWPVICGARESSGSSYGSPEWPSGALLENLGTSELHARDRCPD
jgi:hypothetical protein